MLRSIPAVILIGALAAITTAVYLGSEPVANSQTGFFNSGGVGVTDGRTPIVALPFTISQCGSYFVSGCLVGQSGQSGITIAADDVTLDLNGFALRGVSGSLDGIVASGALSNVEIRNGTVEGWGGDGLDLSTVTGGRLLAVRALGNTDTGVRLGSGVTAVGCTTNANTVDGLVVGQGSTLEGCTADGNGDDGLVVGSYSAVRGCTATNNGGDGFDAAAAFGVVVEACTAATNGGDGIVVRSNSKISGSTARLNGADGIRSTEHSTSVIGCSVHQNTGDGIDVRDSSVVLCRTNGQSNGGAGIRLNISVGTRVEGNNITNSDFGIFADSGAHDTVISDNSVTQNDVGIQVDGAGNLIIKNVSSSNSTSEYVIAVGNRVGSITDVTGGGPIVVEIPTANLIY